MIRFCHFYHRFLECIVVPWHLLWRRNLGRYFSHTCTCMMPFDIYLALEAVVVAQLVCLQDPLHCWIHRFRFDSIHICVAMMKRCTNHPMLLFYTSVSMSAFACMLSTRVGEAANPGPWRNSDRSTRLKCCVLNPTAMYGKTEQIVGMGADVLFVSETSATSLAQSSISKELSTWGYRAFWSPPVEKKFATTDNRPSLRGEASGTAVVTNLFSRQSRIQIPKVVDETCRLATCVVSIANLDVLMVSVYGFPDNHTYQGTKLTDILVTHIYNIVTETKLPFIIGGDFNTPPPSITLF